MGETTPLASSRGTRPTQWLPKTALLSVPQDFEKIFLYLIYLKNAVLLITYKETEVFKFAMRFIHSKWEVYV